MASSIAGKARHPPLLINKSMTNLSPKQIPDPHRWIVRFAFGFKNQAQADAVHSLRQLAQDVVRLWLEVLVPDANAFEQPGVPIETIGFPTRALARRFITTWGGRLLTNPPADPMPSRRQG